MTTRSDIATIRTTNWLLATSLTGLIGDVLHDTAGYPQAELHVEYGITGITIYHQAPPAVVELELVDDELTPDGIDEMDAHVAHRQADAAGETLPEDEAPDETVSEAAPRREAPAPDPDGDVRCEVCESTYRTTRALSDHTRAAHWDDVIEAYAANGVAGIVEGFGVAKSTAYRWATDVRGEAA